MKKISNNEKTIEFCHLIMTISCYPPSRAGIERYFSSAALIHTKTRNRLNNDRVEKLVKVYRYYGRGEEKNELEAAADLEIDLEDVVAVENYSCIDSNQKWTNNC